MDFFAILSGLASIPKLIARIDAALDEQKKVEHQKWTALSLLAEKHIREAESPEDIRKAADEIANLLRTS